MWIGNQLNTSESRRAEIDVGITKVSDVGLMSETAEFSYVLPTSARRVIVDWDARLIRQC